MSLPATLSLLLLAPVFPQAPGEGTAAGTPPPSAEAGQITGDSGGTEAAPAPAPPAEARLTLARLAEARRLLEGLDGLWPGLGGGGVAILVCPGGAGTLLVGPPAPGAEGWVEMPGVPERIAGAWWRPGCEPDPDPLDESLDPVLAADLAGRPRYLLPPTPPPLPGRGAAVGGTEDLIGWLVDGHFRAWSGGRLPRPPGRPGGVLPPAALKRDRELAAEEARWLALALRAPKAKHAREHASRFASVRECRVRLLGEWAPVQRHWETAEGLPAYTIYQALRLGRHDPAAVQPALRAAEPDFAYTLAPALRKALIERLEGPPAGAAPLPADVGFALALVLDRTVHGWRERLLDEGLPLDRLLAP